MVTSSCSPSSALSLSDWADLLGTPGPFTRHQATHALLDAGDYSVSFMAQLLKDPRTAPQHRVGARNVLVRLVREQSSARAAKALVELAGRATPEDCIRVLALEGLAA